MAKNWSVGRRDVLIGGAAVAAAGIAAAFHPKGAFGLGALPAVGTWPWPRPGLDPVKTAGAPAVGLSGCGEISFGLLVGGLCKALPGSAWAALPIQMGSYGNGGGPYGSDCGALQGSLLVMNLVGATPGLRQEFYKWYCDFDFPSAEWDALYPFRDTLRTVSHSPLCHESRAIWDMAYFGQAARPERPDDTRCAKLTRDCVKKAAELINAHKKTGYAGAWAPDEGFKACYECHTDLARKREPGGIHSGREDCLHCHAGVGPHGESGPEGPSGR
jgi:hypothetical protein